MEYKNLKNIHQNQKIVVAGCGTSLSTLKDPSKFITIGVNDVERYVYETPEGPKKFIPNYLVVVNDKPSFKPVERWNYIENTAAPHVFTHIKNLGIKDASKLVYFALGKYGEVNLDKDSIDYTNNSPFIACILAYKMGAKHIGITGVDFQPDHFFGKTGVHVLSSRLNTINNEYANLKRALELKGVSLINLSQTSKLTLPKLTIDEFEKL